jgi:RimJ/RimL family protein N-acetyltransferase
MRIETERLVLRPVRTDDLDDYRRLGIRLEAARREVDYAVEHWAEHGFGPWVVFERSDEERLAGVLEVHYAGEGIGGIEPDEVEIGWTVAPGLRRRGIASEAAVAAVADAFERVGPPHLVAYIRPDNEASLRIAAGLGMRDDGEGTTRKGDRMRIFRLPRPTTIDGA